MDLEKDLCNFLKNHFSNQNEAGETANYNSVIYRPKIKTVNLIGNHSAKCPPDEIIDPLDIPTKLSELQNDVGFISNTADNLLNYFAKSETYSKLEIHELINHITTLNVLTVDTLPTSDISTSTIYLIKEDNTTANVYEQWMYISDNWANLGSTEVDLMNYYNKSEVNALVDGIAAIDDTVVSKTNTWSSTKISEEINTVGDIANDINIAQKTVNARGIKELLSTEVSFPGNSAQTDGTAVYTDVHFTIELKESILKYDLLNIQVSAKSNTILQNSAINSISVSKIVFNNSETELTDGSTISCFWNACSTKANFNGAAHLGIIGWFKDETHFFIDRTCNPIADPNPLTMLVTSIEGINIEGVIVDPVNYVNTTNGIEDTPVGHILSLMGQTAPNHYLICDGTEYNIIDYPHLSQYIKTQFGTFNYFGGDGTTTFAVPDLRNEFLRGYHGDKTEKLSAEIGVHQNATNHVALRAVGTGARVLQSRSTSANFDHNATNIDSRIDGKVWQNYSQSATGNDTGGLMTYTSRPTNTSVLFCIKYEPTYFMSINGLIEEVILWEGSIGTSSDTTAVTNAILLKESIINYDKLGIFFKATLTNGQLRPQYQEIRTEQLKTIIDDNNPLQRISFSCGYDRYQEYTDILPTSTIDKFNVEQKQSHLHKIVGIKYKTFQSGI